MILETLSPWWYDDHRSRESDTREGIDMTMDISEFIASMEKMKQAEQEMDSFIEEKGLSQREALFLFWMAATTSETE